MINSIAFNLIALCIIYISSLFKKSNFRIFYITVSDLVRADHRLVAVGKREQYLL